MDNKQYLQTKFEEVKVMYELNQSAINDLIKTEGAAALIFVYNGKQPATHPLLKVQDQLLSQMMSLQRLIKEEDRVVKEASIDEFLQGP